MADNNENSTRDLFAKEPLSTDSSGNLTPEAIAALLAQNSESSESESELANIDDVIMENYAISENVEEETTEVESVTELEIEAESDSEPLATDASGNLTPEAIAALMAQNNEPEFEPKPVESESAEEAIEDEPVESEISNIESTDDVELETETDTEPLATDASGNLTPEAIAALMAQNNELETEPIESETPEEAAEEETQEPESEAELETEAATEPLATGASGNLTPEAIAALMAQNNELETEPIESETPEEAAEEETQEPESEAELETEAESDSEPLATDASGNLTPEAIAALMAQNNEPELEPIESESAEEAIEEETTEVESVTELETEAATEPLATDASGNLTPEAIAALMAQNNELETEPIESETPEEAAEEETQEPESEAELETEAESDSEPLATDASGNLTPEAIAALMAQNNEPELEPIESESAEEAIEEETTEVESVTELETEAATEPLATDASGNLTPEAIAALMAQNNELETEPIESETSEEAIEEETVEPELEAETETTSEPLATDASGNLTPEAIAALMAQNNEPEPEPVESESAEEEIEEEPVESEIPNIESSDDVEVETETQEPESEAELETETTSEPLATDASGNLTPEAIAALMAQNNESESEPKPVESESIEELDEKEISETEASEIELNNDVEETQDTDVKVETETQEPESEAEVEAETATEPLATDASGNLTPEAIAALMAQNNEPEPEPVESESAEEAIEEEPVESEIPNIESTDDVEVETETTSEPLATDASGNLTPEAIAALMAQNNEPESEPKPVESESIEELDEKEISETEASEIELNNDVEETQDTDVKVETETQEPESEAELETETTSEPLATDASGNLTPEAIAALMAQNNEPEPEPVESESAEEEPVESEIPNIESTDDVEVETETTPEPLATDASGNLTPEAIAALMAQNNEPESEPKPVESESIEELDEKEISETGASEIELNNDVEETQDTDVKVETETATEPLATDASGNLTPEAIAALLAQNSDINLKPEIAEAIANLLVKNDAPNEDEPIETDESTAEDEAESLEIEEPTAEDESEAIEIEESSTEYEVEAIDAAESAADDEKDELKELNPDDIIPSTMSPGESGDGVLSDLEAAAFESDIIDDIFTPEENDEPLSQEAPKDFEFSEYEIPEESEEAPSENEESNETPEPQKEGFDSLGKRVASNDGAKKEEKSKTGKSILTLLLGAFLIVPSLLMKLKPKSKKNAKKKGQNTTEAAVQTESSTENTEVTKENKPRGFMAKLSKKKKNANSDGEDGENNSSGKKKKAKKKKPKPKKKPKKKKKKEKAENSEDQGGNKGGKKKKIIMIAVILIIVLGASAFAAMKFGFINIGKSSSKSGSGDKNGPVGEVLEEEKKDYKEPNILRTEGVDEKADWFKVNFSKRYGLQNEDGLFEVFKLSDKELKAARAAAAEEVLAAKSIISEKAKAPDEGEISKDEAKADSNKKKDKSEDKKSDKDKDSGKDKKSDKAKDSDKDKKSDKAKDSDKDKKSDKKDEESKDEKSTKEPSKKQLAAKAVIKAEDNARNWAYYSASINAYNTIGTEGFKFLNAEFLKKQNEEKVYSSNYNRNTTAMLFSGVNDFKIEKTLISSDYKKAYIEFTRNVNVQRLTDPSVLMDTFLDGIVIGSENPQKFGVELTYDEDLQDFRVNNIYRMEAEKQKKKK